MAPQKPDEHLSREELLTEIQQLRDSTGDTAAYADAMHELEVHQEELRQQQAQLLESQRALEDARDRYAELFDFSPVAYAVVDAPGIVEQANLSAAQLLGMPRSRLIGLPLQTAFAVEDRRRFLDHMARCRRETGRVECELLLQRRDGPAVPVQLVTAPAISALDGHQRFHAAFIDLSEARRAEAERVRARDEQQRVLQDEQVMHAAAEAKDRFLAMVSHELRTPLTPILLVLDGLERFGPISAELRGALDMMRRNVHLERRLVDDLLDMTRIVQGRLSIEPADLDAHALIGDAVRVVEDQLQRAHLRLTVDLTAEEHYIHADAGRLNQVLWNVLHNAIRNTPTGGEVRLRTANRGRDTLLVIVSDTGRGIPPELLPRIFNVFEQDQTSRRRGVGVGLGLSISKSIVESHGGRISAASEGPDRGATLTIELQTIPAPASAAPAPERGPQPASAPPPVSARVLLVEDNEDSAAALAELLRVHGYDVLVAGSMRDALQIADGADILISDIGLPDGSGLDLLRAIVARRPMPAIALSGYGTAEDLRQSAEAGFERHIVKPVEPRRLLEALQSLARS